MKTVFVLHGGETSRETKDNEYFFQQFTSYVRKGEVKILLCYWAREKNEWEKFLLRDKTKIQKETDKKLSFSIVENAENLYQKLPESDVLYVTGGEEYLIGPFLPQLGKLKGMLEGKIFIGSSMGAFIVARNYVLSLSGQADNEVHEGLRIIPLNVLCHWNIEKNKEKKVAMLKDKEPATPILLLDEERSSIFIQ